MLSIRRPSSSPNSSSALPKLVPNVLPCRINRNGPANAKKRFWNVENDEGARNKKIAYFRGRKLEGQESRLPEGYRGVIACSTDRTLAKTTREEFVNPIIPTDSDGDDAGELEETEPIKILEDIGSFDSIVVWDHEKMPEKDDPFIKAVEEWIGFAEAMHSFGDRSDETPK